MLKAAMRYVEMYGVQDYHGPLDYPTVKWLARQTIETLAALAAVGPPYYRPFLREPYILRRIRGLTIGKVLNAWHRGGAVRDTICVPVIVKRLGRIRINLADEEATRTLRAMQQYRQA